MSSKTEKSLENKLKRRSLALPMARSYPLKITFRQQFLIFFAITAILPLLLFSAFFLHKSDILLNNSHLELLRTGIALWEEVVVDTMDRLELSAGSWNFQPERHLSLLMLISPDGRVIESHVPEYTDPKALTHSFLRETEGWRRELLQRHVYAKKGLIALSGRKPGHGLMLVAAVPIIDSKTKQTNILLLGRCMGNVLHSQELASASDEDFSYRLVELNEQGLPNSVTSTNTAMTQVMPRLPALKKASITRKWFKENIAGIDYGSLVHPLKDYQGRVHGYIIVSLSLQAMGELDSENRIYTFFFVCIALGLLILLGARFNRLFIRPIQSLTAISQEVASGNLGARIHIEGGDTTMRQTIHHFNLMLDQLQEKETIRETFISTLSHDLRTPLIAQKRVLDYFQEYVRPNLDAQSANLLTNMQNSTDDQITMIRHLLETFQYDSGKIHLHQKSVSLFELVNQCCATVQAVAESKQIPISNQIDSTTMAWVDATQFKRVIINLLGNSLQNIADGDHIKISCQGSIDTGITLTVHDTGPGIDPGLQEQLFQRYPHSHGRQQQIGSGLGLFICKMIIELHGGTIQVVSKQVNQRGTSFIIQLPPYTLTEGSKEKPPTQTIAHLPESDDRTP